jgi:transposase
MSHQKSIDYKETAVQYYLVEDMTQKEVCKIFKCSPRSLMRWVFIFSCSFGSSIYFTILYKIFLY